MHTAPIIQRRVTGWYNVSIISVFAWLVLAGCTNYDLDNRIRGQLSGSSGTGSSGTVTVTGTTTGGTYANGAFYYTLSNAVKLTAQISLNGSSSGLTVDTSTLPSFVSASIDGNGLLQIGVISNSALFPGVLSPASLNVNLRIFSNTAGEARIPLNLGVKRAFVSSLTALENLTGGTGFTSGCSTGTAIDKVNCGCQNRALAAGLPNAAKYRAWLSYDGGTPVNAMCNLAQKPTGPTLSIGAVLITNPGSGYSSPPSVSFGGCGGATGQVAVATVSNGQIVDVNITNPGTCPTATPSTASASGGGGTAAVLTSIRSACNIKPTDGGPWYSTTNVFLAKDMGAQSPNSLLHVNPLANNIVATEFGSNFVSTPYTGTAANGEYAVNGNCTQWTTFATSCGQVGNTSVISAGWTANAMGGTAAVGQANPFYCFEGD